MTTKYERIVKLEYEVLEKPAGSPNGNFFITARGLCDNVTQELDKHIDQVRSLINRGPSGVIIGDCLSIHTAVAPVGTLEQIKEVVHPTLQ